LAGPSNADIFMVARSKGFTRSLDIILQKTMLKKTAGSGFGNVENGWIVKLCGIHLVLSKFVHEI